MAHSFLRIPFQFANWSFSLPSSPGLAFTALIPPPHSCLIFLKQYQQEKGAHECERELSEVERANLPGGRKASNGGRHARQVHSSKVWKGSRARQCKTAAQEVSRMASSPALGLPAAVLDLCRNAPHSPGQAAGRHFLSSPQVSFPCSSWVMSFGLENGIPAREKKTRRLQVMDSRAKSERKTAASSTS